MTIKDIKRMHLVDEHEGENSESKGRPPKTYVDLKHRLFEGLDTNAHHVHEHQKFVVTKEELGISDKKIIVPSFGTTSKLFSQHFAILRNLRHKIDQLK